MAEVTLVARRIREIREAKKMSRTELAAKLDITRLHLWRIETGVREVSAAFAGEAAEALDVPVASLFRASKRAS